jgi:hypothetical protein
MVVSVLHLHPKGFSIGGQNVERNSEEYKMQYDFPNQLSGQGKGLTVCA